MTEQMRRRRALMGVGGAPAPEPNGLAPGTGYGNGSTVASVNNSGQLEIETYSLNGWNNRIEIPLIREIEVKSGDVIEFSMAKVETNTGWIGWTIYLGSNYIGYATNVAVNNSTKTFDAYTATSDYSIGKITLQKTSGSISNATIALHMKINGEDVF